MKKIGVDKSKLKKRNKKQSQKKWRWGRMIGVAVFFISTFLFLAFVSYIDTWKIDQDKVLQFSSEVLLNSDLKVENWMGRLGAVWSHNFFYKGIGVTSFIVTIYGFTMALLFYFGVKWSLFFRYTKYLILGLIFLPVLFGFFLVHSTSAGAVGTVTFLVNWLTTLLGTIGTFCLIFAVIVAFVTWHIKNLPQSWVESAETVKNINLSSVIKKSEKANDDKNLDIDIEEIEDQEESYEENAHSQDKRGGQKKTLLDKLRWNSKSKKSQEHSDAMSDKALQEEKTKAKNEERVNIEENIVEFEDASAQVKERLKSNPQEDDLEIEITTEKKETTRIAAEKVSSPKTEEVTDRIELYVETEDEEETLDPYDPTKDLSNFEFPGFDMLSDYETDGLEIDREELTANKNQIVRTLEHYKIKIEKIKATVGPTITLYEIVPEPGIRISKIKNLEDDIALSLAALGIRIIAPMPGKGTIGIEVPNKNTQIVGFKELVTTDKFQMAKMELPIALGKTISNEVFVADLAKMPHLLVAGATGQGKSVGINTIITSLLYKKHPSQLKLVLIDPKKVELFPYTKLKNHYLAFLPGEDEPIITDTKKVVYTLNSLCIEMDRRYDLLKKGRARNIKEYNSKFISRRLNPNKGHEFLPFIVLVVDEFADLIMTAGKEVEMPIARLAQLARAVGIHLIIATQRPSVNIITGVIKANFPARIAFKVTSKVDSRTILDTGGADQLIGKGDMLMSSGGDLVRLQCAFVDTPEVENIIDFIGDQKGYAEPFYLPEPPRDDADEAPGAISITELDDNFEDAARLLVATQQGSTSMIQRRMKLGYNRAGRIMDQLEHFGIVGENQGSKARDVLFQTEMELEQHLEMIRQQKEAATGPVF